MKWRSKPSAGSLLPKSNRRFGIAHKLHNDKFNPKKPANVGLDASLKVSIIPDDEVIGLRNLARDYYYFKDL